MKSIKGFLEQLALLREDVKQCNNSEVTTNLLNDSIDESFYLKISKDIQYLVEFHDNYLNNSTIKKYICEVFDSTDNELTKLPLLIDIVRCFDGLEHTTSFNSREGLALLLLLSKLFSLANIYEYEDLEHVDSISLSLINLIPYIDECSHEIGDINSLLVSSIFAKCEYCGDKDVAYRKHLYKFCKDVAIVDNDITLSEQDWLDSIARLDDEDSSNDIDLTEL